MLALNSIPANLATLFMGIAEGEAQRKVDRESYFSQFSFLPPTISLSNGRVVLLGPSGPACISAIAKILRDNSSELRAALTLAETTNAVSRAIGDLLAETEAGNAYEIPDDETEFGRALVDRVQANTAAARIDLSHVFGAWVVRAEGIDSIDVGPVRFEQRDLWLKRMVSCGLISEQEAARIIKMWTGAVVRRFRDAFSAESERALVDAIGPCPWVCTIKLVAHSNERSREKALIAARIALAAISLAWRSPPRLVTTGLIYESGPTRGRSSIAFGPTGPRALAHETLLREGRYVGRAGIADFEQFLAEYVPTVGRCIASFIAAMPLSEHPRMESAICRALIWFGEACNEPLDSVAIVKFGIALDSLANGRRFKGVCDLLQNRVGIDDLDAVFLTDGTSAKKLAQQVYDHGRSQIAHGARPGFFEDLAQLRFRSAFMARMALLSCISFMSDYSGSDTVDAIRQPAS